MKPPLVAPTPIRAELSATNDRILLPRNTRNKKRQPVGKRAIVERKSYPKCDFKLASDQEQPRGGTLLIVTMKYGLFFTVTALKLIEKEIAPFWTEQISPFKATNLHEV